MSGCTDKRAPGKAQRKAKQRKQVRRLREGKIWMGAIWRHFPLVQAAAHAGGEGAGGYDGIQFLEHDTSHKQIVTD
eukprot:10825183-Heterocapsa_arctica.AAC.1